MQVPIRLLRAVRPQEHPGLLLATAYGTAVLSVGPFLLPALADHYDIGLGLASFATAAQLGGFVLGSWGAGRRLRPRGRVLGVALLVALVANGASVLLPPFPVLVALRVLSGICLGVITWFAWSQVFGDERRMGEIAVVGPLVGVTTTPVAAALIDGFGPEGVFAVLAITAVVPLAVSRRSGSSDPALVVRRDIADEDDGGTGATDGAGAAAAEYDRGDAPASARHAPTARARAILVCLGVMTLGGSSVFTYGAVIATRTTSLSLSAVSLAYSANALASIPSARWTGRRGTPGVWVALCGVAAVTMGASSNAAAFVVAIAAWGFCFWMGVPAAYALLARCSRWPEERAGDAQAVMAVGRVVGPLAGGVLLDATGPAALGLIGGALLALAGAGLVAVDRSSPEVEHTA